MNKNELDIFAARFREFLKEIDPKVFKTELRSMFFAYLAYALRNGYPLEFHLFVQDIERFMFHVLESGDYDKEI